MINEDFEREHLKDQLYLKEAKWLEMEHYYKINSVQKPAKIKLLLEKNPRLKQKETQ